MTQSFIQIPLVMTDQQIKDGHADVTARMNEAQVRDLKPLDYEWKLVTRWPVNGKPVFAAESKVLNSITGKKVKIQLHRFALGLHDRSKDSPKIYVIPRDGNALHCEFSNLQQLTQAEWDERKHRSAGRLTQEQQAWLDAECEKTGLGKWGVVGALIQEKLEQASPFD